MARRASRHQRAQQAIAFLEANPDIDEGYKAPIIRQLRADIYKLRATLYPADWEWATPCCYGRPPIHIR